MSSTESNQTGVAYDAKVPKGNRKIKKHIKQSAVGDLKTNQDGEEVAIPMQLSQLSKPDVPLYIDLKNVKYEIPIKPTKANPELKSRVLLNDINAYFTPGELVAVMGPTGSGKSTFLNVLSRRNKVGVSGDLLYNGTKPNSDIKRQVAYVLQDDVLFPHLTVHETLSYAAQLRQPAHLSYEEKMCRVDEIITALNLGKARNTIIGGPGQRGVSGGERKRVNIGVQLLSNPSAIFLDEPTSGLDTSSAFSLVRTLREISRSGYTVISTIHQPASHIYDLFDKILLLLDGNVVYFGAVGDLKHYLKNSIGLKCPPQHNPADYLMSHILEEEIREGGNSAPAGKLKQHCIDTWLRHGQSAYRVVDVDDEPRERANKSTRKLPDSRAADLLEAKKKQDTSKRPKFAISWFKQVGILSHRAFWKAYANYVQIIPLAQHILVSLIVGAVWWQTPYAQASVPELLGVAFFIAIYTGGFVPLLESIFNFPQERVVIERERSDGTYRMSAYFFSKVITEIPFQLIGTTIFTVISYWMAGLRKEAGSFFLFLVLMYASNIASSGAGLIIGSVTRDLRVASVSAMVFMYLCMLTAGFYRPSNVLPVWFGWLQYISFAKYLYDGSIQTIFAGLTLPGVVGDVSGDSLIDAIYPVISQGPGWNVMALFAFAVVFRIIAFVALKLSFRFGAK